MDKPVALEHAPLPRRRAVVMHGHRQIGEWLADRHRDRRVVAHRHPVHGHLTRRIVVHRIHLPAECRSLPPWQEPAEQTREERWLWRIDLRQAAHTGTVAATIGAV